MSQKAFTLVELIIVIVVIAVVAIVILPQFTIEPQRKAQDDERRVEINTIADQYLQNAISDGKFKPMSSKIPTPPEGGTYQGLIDQETESFKICAVLSKGKDLNCLENSDNPNCYCRSSHTDLGLGNNGFNNGGGNAQLATPSPTPTPIPQVLPNYQNTETKLLRTIAVFFMDEPNFPPNGGSYNIQISKRADFGGDFTETYTYFGTISPPWWNPATESYIKFKQLVPSKMVGYNNFPHQNTVYSSSCGQTLYYRAANYYNKNDTSIEQKAGTVYSATVDCTTTVGVVDPPLSWYTVYDMTTNQQKYYESSWDFDQNGVIDYTDYWLGAFTTKFRSGGWQPPE